MEDFVIKLGKDLTRALRSSLFFFRGYFKGFYGGDMIMKDAIIRKIKELKDNNREIRRNLEDHYNLRWCFRTPEERSWQKACVLIDQLYANNETIRLLEKRLAETER